MCYCLKSFVLHITRIKIFKSFLHLICEIWTQNLDYAVNVLEHPVQTQAIQANHLKKEELTHFLSVLNASVQGPEVLKILHAIQHNLKIYYGALRTDSTTYN